MKKRNHGLKPDAGEGFRTNEIPARPAPRGIPCIVCGEPVDDEGECRACACPACGAINRTDCICGEP